MLLKKIKLVTLLAVITFLVVTPFSFAQNVNTGAAAIGIDNQAQGQGQGQSIDDHSINEAADLDNGRAFANSGAVQYGPVLNYFGQPLPSEGFQPVEQLIMYSCWFTEGALESILDDVEDSESEFKVANLYIANAAPASEDGVTRWIKVVISTVKYEGANVDFKGFVTARSDDKRTTMTEVMAEAALAALQNGCNVVHFTAQGAVRDVFSSGWGIGFNTTQASLFGGGNAFGNVTSGGTGYSSAQAGTRDLPWLQGFGLVDADLVYPALAIPAAE